MMKTTSRVRLDELLGPVAPAIADELEPLFQEAVHDAEVQAALRRGELPAMAAALRPEVQWVLRDLLPATLEELAERIELYQE